MYGPYGRETIGWGYEDRSRSFHVRAFDGRWTLLLFGTVHGNVTENIFEGTVVVRKTGTSLAGFQWNYFE